MWKSMMVEVCEFSGDLSSMRKLEASPRLFESTFEEFLVDEKLTPADLEARRIQLHQKLTDLRKESSELNKARAPLRAPGAGEITRPEVEVEKSPDRSGE